MNPEHVEDAEATGPVESQEGLEGAATERTGVVDVDRVLEQVESVGSLPVAERVAVFEQAHAELRRALDPGPTSDEAGR